MKEEKIRKIRAFLREKGINYYCDRREGFYRFKCCGLLSKKLKDQVEKLGGKVERHDWFRWGLLPSRLVHVIKVF